MAAVFWGPEAILYSTTGAPAKRALMEVKEFGTEILASLFASADKSQVLANPIRTDQYGNLSFYIDPGRYTVNMLESTYSFNIDIPVPGGGSGGGASFEHVQTIAQSVWSVTHNLGFRPPAVSLFSLDYGTEYDEYTVFHVNANQLTISMDNPTAGRALM
jgi:hypothetical protein